MINDADLSYLKQAIENSKKSFEAGNFPAGALVVKNDEILASTVSSPYPGLFHPDSKAVTEAFNKVGPLTGATLYIGLESCLMCSGVAYWSGLRRIIYAVSKVKVSGDYYETPLDTQGLIKTFNQPLEMIQIPTFEAEALSIIRAWEQQYQKLIESAKS